MLFCVLVLALAYVTLILILNQNVSRPWSVVAGPCPSRPVRAARGCGVQGGLAGAHKNRYNAKSQRYNATDSVSDVKARETERDERRWTARHRDRSEDDPRSVASQPSRLMLK